MDCTELVKKAKKGDGDAFSTLIKKYEIDLYRVAKAMVKKDEDALDCIQETILKAFQSIHKLKKEEYFKTWLIRILINKCKDLIKSRKRTILYADFGEDIPVNSNLESLEINEAMDKLHDKLKVLVILYYFEDMGIKEIAESLDMPEGTVKSRLSRARIQLKEFLDYKERGIV